jgi:DNA (cytosine-5)-methyltransferase 1
MNYTFIDLFAGIGGFHLALNSLGAQCVLTSEIDKYAQKTYTHNLSSLFADNHIMTGDITQVLSSAIPDFNILCAGFPCQPFSQSGKKKGFDDTRGTLFFEIARIIRDKKPDAFFLENVRNFVKHDNGNTFSVIKKTLEDMGYSFYHKVIHATDFNCPQHRPRVYMVGFRQGIEKVHQFDFPQAVGRTITMSDIFGAPCTREVGFTLRVGGKGSPINDRHNWDGYIVDGKEVRLTPETAKLMQGFPQNYEFPVSKQQAMKQVGNSVAIPVIKAIAKNIIEVLEKNKNQ